MIHVESVGFIVAEWGNSGGPVFQAVERWDGVDPLLLAVVEGKGGNPSRWRGPERRTREGAEADGGVWRRETDLAYWADRLGMP